MHLSFQGQSISASRALVGRFRIAQGKALERYLRAARQCSGAANECPGMALGRRLRAPAETLKGFCGAPRKGTRQVPARAQDKRRMVPP
eukprot:9491726-Pyramimonas_sp.AAC.2